MSHPKESFREAVLQRLETRRKVKNRYAKGRRNEWKSMEVLRDAGWLCFRTAGSHTDWDIIALKPGWQPMLIQVKTNKKPTLKTFDLADEWSLRIHLWIDYKGLQIYDMRTGNLVDFL